MTSVAEKKGQAVKDALAKTDDIKPAVTTEESEVLEQYSKALLEQAIEIGKDNEHYDKYNFVQLPYAKLQNGNYIPLIDRWKSTRCTSGRELIIKARIILNSSQAKATCDTGLGTYKSQDIGGSVEAALRAGYRHIDCASHYGNEPLIGEAIVKVLKEGVVKRDQLFITSKLWNDDHEGHKVKPALVKTLKDLGLDYIDLFLVHWPFTDQNTKELTPPYKETWQAMEKLVEDGLAKNIGVSNMSIKKLKDVLSYAKVKPAVNQVEVHPYFRNQELIDYSASEGVHITAFSSLGTPSSAGHLVKKSAPNPSRDPIIREIGKKRGRIAQEVIVRWGMQHGTSVLVKSATPKHIQSNIVNTCNWSLTDEEYAAITGIKHQLRLLDGCPWLHEVGPYRTFEELWDDDGETERERNKLISDVYNFVDIPTVTVGNEDEMPLISFGTGPAVENETRWEIKEAIQAGHRHFDVSTTGQLAEVKEGLGLAFLEKMVSRDELWITATVRNYYDIPGSVKQILKDLDLNSLNLLLLPADGSMETIRTRWEQLEELYHKNLVQAIGLRDCTVYQLQQLMASSNMVPSVVSVEVHPFYKNEELVTFCKKKDIFVISHSPSGMETGKSKSEERSQLLTDPVVTGIAYEINKANKQLNQHRLQVLLRWVLQYGVAAVCEAAGKEIDRANVGVFEWELKSQDFKKLSNIKPS